MLDLVLSPVAVITCIAAPQAVEAVVAAGGGSAFWAASDEAMVLGEPENADDLVRAVAGVAAAHDPDALVVDASDGWCRWRLEGDVAREAFERLSQVPLPAQGFAQGEIAHVPARVVVRAHAIDVLVLAMVGEHFRDRVLADCRRLGVREHADTPAGKPLR